MLLSNVTCYDISDGSGSVQEHVSHTKYLCLNIEQEFPENRNSGFSVLCSELVY
jgi:hypothetical protein